jgi:multiple sugar transport system permease protein
MGGPANATQLPATLSYQLSFQNFQFGQGAAMADLMIVVLSVLACIYLWLSRLSTSAW